MNTTIITIGLIAIFALLLFTKHNPGRNSSEWKMTRLAVLRRDKFTCQKCGKQGGYLEVHHKESWASRPDLRFTLSNLQAICKPCHEQTESYKYWKSNN
jgi:5-methylcytosine-specific restriction endonuclease McrA